MEPQGLKAFKNISCLTYLILIIFGILFFFYMLFIATPFALAVSDFFNGSRIIRSILLNISWVLYVYLVYILIRFSQRRKD